MDTIAGQRYEASLERDLNRIREKVTAMAALGEEALKTCVRALLERNRELAYAVILRDQYIDEMEKEIDRLCLEFLVRQQPVASTLRFAYSTIKVNLDLERVGDYTESIARQTLKLMPLAIRIPTGRYVEMADLSVAMLRDAVKSFVDQDADLARKTIEVEDTVDGLKRALNKDLVGWFREDDFPLEALNAMMMITRRFEHVSDQARSICQEALYVCSGEYAKHEGADTFRVLFVDQTHAGVSRMAEAIGAALNQPNFLFAGAGLEPRTVDPRVERFLAEKGLAVDPAARAPEQIPNLEYYQVVITFGKAARQALRLPPAKRVELDWDVADPAQCGGNEGEARAACEQAFGYLQGHIRELVRAIVGTETESKQQQTSKKPSV